MAVNGNVTLGIHGKETLIPIKKTMILNDLIAVKSAGLGS
jgi:hypothetical protein